MAAAEARVLALQQAATARAAEHARQIAILEEEKAELAAATATATAHAMVAAHSEVEAEAEALRREAARESESLSAAADALDEAVTCLSFSAVPATGPLPLQVQCFIRT